MKFICQGDILICLDGLILPLREGVPMDCAVAGRGFIYLV
jgi:hypothetical protein